MFAGLFGSNTAKNNASIKASPQRRLSTTAVGQPPVIISRPPFPHPLPYSKIRVVCSADGLILSGLRSRDSSFSKRSILISYGKAAATSVLEDYDATLDSSAPTCTSYGCLGVLRLFQGKHTRKLQRRRTLKHTDGQRHTSSSLPPRRLSEGMLECPRSESTA